MGMDNQAIEQLPSLPQLLLRIVEAVHDEQKGLPDLADLIRQDAAITARLLEAANSSYFNTRSQPCPTLERALLMLGLENVKTLVVTAAMQQFIGSVARPRHAFLKLFWRQSLVAANFAQVLAGLTSYRNPSGAYLAGLLHQVGQIVLLTVHEERWLSLWRSAANPQELALLERQQLGRDHCEIGAALVEGWHGTGLMADAIRFSLEPAAAVQDANHLVKITNLSAALSAGQPDDDSYGRADRMFGLGEALTRELNARIVADVGRLAATLKIDINAGDADAHAAQELGTRLGELAQLGQWSLELWRARSLQALEHAVRRIAAMTLGSRKAILFALSPSSDALEAWLDSDPEASAGAGEPDFSLPLLPDRSIVVEAFLQRMPRAVSDQSAQIVVDRQLLRFGREDSLLCLPLVADDEALGVLVLPLAEATSREIGKSPLTATLCREIAAAIRNQRQTLAAAVEQSPPDHLTASWEQKIREAIHEAGNPLSIIRNYLEVLRARLGVEHGAHGELDLIKDEIDRVGGILLRLREPAIDEGDQQAELDRLVDDTALLFEQSLFATHDIRLIRRANAPQCIVARPAHLKQILVNLLKNAVEAMPDGGVIELNSDSPVVIDGRTCTAITITDNGPGVPPAVMSQLFQPIASSKGGAGIGLSVVQRLAGEMGGKVRCRSSAAGTTFELLLPPATAASNGAEE